MIEETDRETRVLKQGLLVCLAFTLLGWAALVHMGSKHTTEWATYATRDAKPSLEIVP